MIPKIPRCMSTSTQIMSTRPSSLRARRWEEDEIQEAYYVFSHLDCEEQMWDCEGKEVDNYVVKLLSKYDWYFKEKQLGKDVFLTLRSRTHRWRRTRQRSCWRRWSRYPAPSTRPKLFYANDIPPIFEVILPMAASATSWTASTATTDFVIGKQHMTFGKTKGTLADWIGIRA